MFCESNTLYKTNNLSITKETPKEVKLRINIPLHVHKKIKDTYVGGKIGGLDFVL
ncbi:MAG TPA: hypothetical protein VLA48_00570 [Nitrososphaeraceae archaeon]|nr:hypothetical protein [Nitrososphaeraceae archaeon]